MVCWLMGVGFRGGLGGARFLAGVSLEPGLLASCEEGVFSHIRRTCKTKRNLS